MAQFRSSSRGVSVRVIPKIPALIEGVDGLEVIKSAGRFTFGPNLRLLPVSADVDNERAFVWMQDVDTGQFWAVSLQSLKGSGPRGAGGWSPVLGGVADGERRVHQVADWTGGDGEKPPAGMYVGPAGFTADIASATNIRGAAGAGTGDMLGENNLSDVADVPASRGNLGLGALATASSINNANWSGTALAIANGGTGATTDSGARAALSLVPGTDILAYDADLAGATAAGKAVLTAASATAQRTLVDAEQIGVRRDLGYVTGSTTLQAGHRGMMIQVDSSSDSTITVPTNASVAFPIGTWIDVVQLGTGYVQISPASGVTLRSKGGNRWLSDRYAAATLVKSGTNQWYLIGDLAG